MGVVKIQLEEWLCWLNARALLTRGSDIHGIIWYKVSYNRLLECITPAFLAVVCRSFGYLYFFHVYVLAPINVNRHNHDDDGRSRLEASFLRLFYRDPRILNSFLHVDQVYLDRSISRYIPTLINLQK